MISLLKKIYSEKEENSFEESKNSEILESTVSTLSEISSNSHKPKSKIFLIF